MAAAFLTNSGRTKLLNASPESPVKVLHMAIGSGTGTPSASMSALFNEAARVEIPNPLRDVNYPTVLKFTGIIPTTVGGFSITEIGLFDSAGVLLAYQLLEQPISKPSAGGPLAVTLEVVMALQLDNATQTTLIVTESNEYQHNQMTHRDAADCHPIVAVTGLRGELDSINTEIARDRLTKKITANYTVLPTDGGMIEIDASAGNITVTMAKASTHIAAEIGFIRTDSSANTVSIFPTSGDLFAGEGFVWPQCNLTRFEPFIFKKYGATRWTVVSGDNIQINADTVTNKPFFAKDGVMVDELMINDSFIGMVAPFAMNTAPYGWLECSGQAVSRLTYAKLFLKIGTRYGAGDGVNTFTLPDMRGEFVRGWDNGRGVDFGHAFGTNQNDSVQFHNHFLPTGTTETGAAKAYAIPDTTFQKTTVNNGAEAGTENTTYPNPDYNNPTYVGNVGTFSRETRPRNIALLYCIKY